MFANRYRILSGKLCSSFAHEALVQRLNDAGYKVLETRPGERGLVWTLEPLHSRVEFQIVGQQELLQQLRLRSLLFAASLMADQ